MDYNEEEVFNIESAMSWYAEEINNLFSVLDFADKNKSSLQYWQLSQAMANYIKRAIPTWRVIEVYKKAVLYTIDFGNIEMLVSSLTELALAHQEAGDFDQASVIFKDAENLWRNPLNKESLAYVLNGYGFTLERLGKYEEALKILDEALIVQDENQYGEAYTLNATGAVYWRMHKYDDALNIFSTALKIRKKIKDYIGTASTINNMAFSHLKLGSTSIAKRMFFNSKKIFRKYHDRHGEAVVLNNLGYTSIELKNLKKAKNYATSARDIAVNIGDGYQIGRSFDVEGKAYLESGDKNRGILLLQEALKIFIRLNVPEVKEIENIIGQINK